MELSVLAYLENAVIQYRDRIAFRDKESQLTFLEFDRYTKSIGTFIASRTQSHSPVVVMTGRHIYTPACYLGIVQAGCFYAPMDAEMPVHRLNQILGVIQAGCMIVDREHLEKARSLEFKGDIFILEDILQTPVDEVLLDKAHAETNDTTPLYVIFTSGSTGVPKGVITSHHSLMCYIDAVNTVLDLNEDDVLGNQSPLDYIAAIRDIYLPLKTGASTLIIPKNEFAMPEQLFETLNTYRVTTLCWSAAGVELPAKLGAFDCGKPEYLRKVIFSGSVISGKYLKIWQQHLPEVQFINQYGPTEATASCTYYVVKEKVEDDTVLPIGVPYKHYRILLLNEDNTATPQGETGEICVLGPCLALGYYGDVKRTAESFIQNPLNPNYREYLYKTGDLGRIREDGQLEFGGRKDRQVKHMGHRIELGEIEVTAKQLENIDDCCAIYDKEKELLYLFYTGEAKPKEIVLHFRKLLPAFMVPRKLVRLEQIPVLPNGKTDMQTLKTYLKK